MLPLEDRELLTATMVGLNMDPRTIASLMASFDRAAESLETRPIPSVGSAAFGDSFTGGYRLATNVDMAHQAVAEELSKLALGLRGMRESVGAFSTDVQTTTEQTVATMTRIQASTECLTSPEFGDGQCSVPTTEA